MGVGRFFPRAGKSGLFQGVAKQVFSREGAKVVKTLKLRFFLPRN